jgi:spore coat polysaccharide biosynthesis predicted glycosyltransferase SpsG
MRYVLRSDASLEQGSGHVLRSLAIFEELKSRGHEIVFVGRITNLSWVDEKIRQAGFKNVFEEENDFLHNSLNDVLVLDSYEIDTNSPFVDKLKWHRVVTIVDDFTPAYSSDLMVRPSILAVTDNVTGSKVLSGLKYFPLRNDIRKTNADSDASSLFRVIVVGGGTDFKNFASTVSQVLKKSSFEMSVTFVTKNVEISGLDDRFRVIPPGLEVEKFISNANLAFTTASTSAIEFIAREIPIGIACAVPNQEDYFQVLPNLGLAVQIGRFKQDDWDLDEDAILDLLENHSRHSVMREQMKGMFDLNSTSRIVDEILKL